jgi:bis(5'-nucleosyl)-tetraphosphatase (symmetrical)
LLGNHDLHLLAAAHGSRRLRRGDTFDDVLDAPDSRRWLDWLRHRKLAHLECGWLCVHAGVLPSWDTEQALALAQEVEELLRGKDLEDFLHVMYSDEPARWDPHLSGHDRHRFIVNAFTRMRLCNADGLLDFKTKENVAAAPTGLLPWFEVPGRRTLGQPVAFGHWSTLGLVHQEQLLGLDTGCVWGGSLTAVRVDGGRREVLQVPCETAQRPQDFKS